MDRMPPPLPKLPGSLSGHPPKPGARLLRQQAMTDAAMHSSGMRGPLATIPDGSPSTTGTSEGPPQPSASSPAARRSAVVATSWDQYFDEQRDVQLEDRGGTFRVYLAGSRGPVVYCMHGGGYTGLTWAPVAVLLKDRYRVAAVDLRGHGQTSTANDQDLSADTQAQDAAAVWVALYGQEQAPTVLVGHSMGGAVAVHAAALKGQVIKSLEGLVVIDVVEGTALPSLPLMLTILKQRPASFASPEAAIEWALKSGMSKNAAAASVSLPASLKPDESGRWVWRTPLEQSQPYWEGWYRGLSDLYLSVTVPKVLILAGTDRLDRPLTIGQMQGKFQMVLLPQAGHAIHEDEAQRTADVLSNFLKRFRIGQPKVPFPRAPGVGVVLPQAAGPPA